MRKTGRERLSGVAAVSCFVFVALTVVEVILFALHPQPESVEGWFGLFVNSPLAAIVAFWGLELLMYVIFVVVFAALHVEMRDTSVGATVISLVFVAAGAAVFFSTNNPAPMMALAREYHAAVGRADQAGLLAAGQSLVLQTGQRAVGGFNIALMLVSAAGVSVSVSMFRDKRFGSHVPVLGLIGHGMSLLDYVRQALTDNALVALAVIVPGTLVLLVWFVLLAFALLRSAAEAPRREAGP